MTRLARRNSGPTGAGLAVVAVAVASAALLAGAGARDPRLDVLAHFAPVYLGLALVCLLATIVVRRHRILTAAAGLAAVAASVTLMAPEFTRDTGPAAPPDAPGQIKVIQINALRTNTDIERVADWLIAQHPDVVTVSEARHDLRDLMIARGWKTAGAHGDLMIFTRQNYRGMDRPFPGDRSWLTFVNATYATSSGPAEFVTAHLDWPTVPTVTDQTRDLVFVADRRPRRRMILTGDFNAAPWSHEVRRLDRDLGLYRRDRALATWPAMVLGRPWPLPFLPIDHVYAGPGWATVKVERGPWVGSDHYPVIVTLAPVAPH